MDDPIEQIEKQQGGQGPWKWAVVFAFGVKALDHVCHLWLRRAAALDAAERRLSDRMDSHMARQAIEIGDLGRKVEALELELAEERRQKDTIAAENRELRARVAELERLVEQLKSAAPVAPAGGR